MVLKVLPFVVACATASASPFFAIPLGPQEICIEQQCVSVKYTLHGRFILAESEVNGYPFLGRSTQPCFFEKELCLKAGKDAYKDLEGQILPVLHYEFRGE